MSKVLASDIDGTLFVNEKIHDIDKESILKLKNENYLFGVSTGRSYNGVKFIKEEYGIDIDFYVLLNGALVLDKNKNILEHKVIPYDIIKKIYTKYNYCDLLGLDGTDHTSILIGENKLTWDNIRNGNIDEAKNHDYSLISMDFSSIPLDKVDLISEEINKEFGEVVVSYRNSTFIDVVPKGCSKGTGLNIIINKLKLNRDNIYVIGDSFNDISMFKETKNSFTFNRAEERLKPHAKFIVDSVSECIEKYIL